LFREFQGKFLNILIKAYIDDSIARQILPSTQDFHGHSSGSQLNGDEGVVGRQVYLMAVVQYKFHPVIFSKIGRIKWHSDLDNCLINQNCECLINSNSRSSVAFV